MKIGYDGKRAVQNFTGLGNYSRYVLEALQEYFPDNEYVVYATKWKENPRLNSVFNNRSVTLRLPFLGWWRKFPFLWRTWGMTSMLKMDKIELYHGLSNEIPLNIRRVKGMRKIVTVHDLIFLRLPKCYHFIDRLIYNHKFKRSCKIADRIIAVSECTKRDIMNFYRVPADKIEVICQGCDPIFSNIASEERKSEVRRLYALPEHYILSVGTIEERKNALLAVKAMRHLPEQYHLVLVGWKKPYAKQVEEFILQSGLEQRVHIKEGVPFADLPVLFQCADVFVYPSYYEGFGIPVLEALNSRVPVVAAAGSCLEEAGGPHSLYVHPDDDKGLADAIVQSLIPQNRQRMIAEGLKWASKFSKEQMARETMKCYDAVLKQQME